MRKFFRGLIEFVMKSGDGLGGRREVWVQERVSPRTHKFQKVLHPGRIFLACQLCSTRSFGIQCGGTRGKERVKFDPFFPKVESCITVRRLPEEVDGLTSLSRNTLNGWALQEWRCENLRVIEMVRRKFEAKAHEVVRLLEELALGGVFKFKEIIHEIMIVQWRKFDLG